jgi:phage shock protein A
VVKRKKRLEKGIESLEEQVNIHEEKKEAAKELGQENLVEYYTGEIERLKQRKKDRERKLHRKD